MYEMLTGSLPFHANTAAELAHLHIEAEPVPIAEMLPDISPVLEQILTKVLSKEPSQRYRTADQLGRVLLNFGNAKSSPALALTPEAVTVPTSLPAATIVSSICRWTRRLTGFRLAWGCWRWWRCLGLFRSGCGFISCIIRPFGEPVWHKASCVFGNNV